MNEKGYLYHLTYNPQHHEFRARRIPIESETWKYVNGIYYKKQIGLVREASGKYELLIKNPEKNDNKSLKVLMKEKIIGYHKEKIKQIEQM